MPQAPPPHFKNSRRNADEDNVVPRSKRHGRFGVRFRNQFVDAANDYGGAAINLAGEVV